MGSNPLEVNWLLEKSIWRGRTETGDGGWTSGPCGWAEWMRFDAPAMPPQKSEGYDVILKIP